MLKTPLIAAAAGLTLAAMPSLASAETQESITVEYRDLDLTTDEGQKKLDRRIERAAETVCKLNEIRTGTRVRSQASAQCFKEARAAVMAQVAAKIEKAGLGG